MELGVSRDQQRAPLTCSSSSFFQKSVNNNNRRNDMDSNDVDNDEVCNNRSFLLNKDGGNNQHNFANRNNQNLLQSSRFHVHGNQTDFHYQNIASFSPTAPSSFLRNFFRKKKSLKFFVFVFLFFVIFILCRFAIGVRKPSPSDGYSVPSDDVSLVLVGSSSECHGDVSCGTLNCTLCKKYPYPTQYDTTRLLLEDADPQTNKFLFRSSMPLNAHTGSFAYDILLEGVKEKIQNANLNVPSKIKFHIFALYWEHEMPRVALKARRNHDTEMCEYAQEKCFFLLKKTKGDIVHWPVAGTQKSPYDFDKHEREKLAKTFPEWDKDDLHYKVEYLHNFIHTEQNVWKKDVQNAMYLTHGKHKTDFKEHNDDEEGDQKRKHASKTLQNNEATFLNKKKNKQNEEKGKKNEKDEKNKTDINAVTNYYNNDDGSQNDDDEEADMGHVAVFHCHEGKDRTGEVSGAYNMAYNKHSLNSVWMRNKALKQSVPSTINSMMWYCLYLELQMNLTHVKCYDIYETLPRSYPLTILNTTHVENPEDLHTYYEYPQEEKNEDKTAKERTTEEKEDTPSQLRKQKTTDDTHYDDEDDEGDEDENKNEENEQKLIEVAANAEQKKNDKKNDTRNNNKMSKSGQRKQDKNDVGNEKEMKEGAKQTQKDKEGEKADGKQAKKKKKNDGQKEEKNTNEKNNANAAVAAPKTKKKETGNEDEEKEGKIKGNNDDDIEKKKVTQEKEKPKHNHNDKMKKKNHHNRPNQQGGTNTTSLFEMKVAEEEQEEKEEEGRENEGQEEKEEEGREEEEKEKEKNTLAQKEAKDDSNNNAEFTREIDSSSEDMSALEEDDESTISDYAANHKRKKNKGGSKNSLNKEVAEEEKEEEEERQDAGQQPRLR